MAPKSSAASRKSAGAESKGPIEIHEPIQGHPPAHVKTTHRQCENPNCNTLSELTLGPKIQFCKGDNCGGAWRICNCKKWTFFVSKEHAMRGYVCPGCSVALPPMKKRTNPNVTEQSVAPDSNGSAAGGGGPAGHYEDADASATVRESPQKKPKHSDKEEKYPSGATPASSSSSATVAIPAPERKTNALGVAYPDNEKLKALVNELAPKCGFHWFEDVVIKKGDLRQTNVQWATMPPPRGKTTPDYVFQIRGTDPQTQRATWRECVIFPPWGLLGSSSEIGEFGNYVKTCRKATQPGATQEEISLCSQKLLSSKHSIQIILARFDPRAPADPKSPEMDTYLAKLVAKIIEIEDLSFKFAVENIPQERKAYAKIIDDMAAQLKQDEKTLGRLLTTDECNDRYLRKYIEDRCDSMCGYAKKKPGPFKNMYIGHYVWSNKPSDIPVSPALEQHPVHKGIMEINLVQPDYARRYLLLKTMLWANVSDAKGNAAKLTHDQIKTLPYGGFVVAFPFTLHFVNPQLDGTIKKLHLTAELEDMGFVWGPGFTAIHVIPEVKTTSAFADAPSADSLAKLLPQPDTRFMTLMSIDPKLKANILREFQDNADELKKKRDPLAIVGPPPTANGRALPPPQPTSTGSKSYDLDQND